MASHEPDNKRIFILSRPGDADGWRQRIEVDLRSRGILATNLSEATAVLVIVGLRFQTSPPSSRRSGADVTYKQLRQALATTKIIIPILVDGASMPDSRTLPQDIQQFSYRQALTVKNATQLDSVLARAISITRVKDTKREKERPFGHPLSVTVFISYRHGDVENYWAGMLAQALKRQLGPEAVFFDEGGEREEPDSRSQFEDLLYQSSDVIVVIGDNFFKRKGLTKRYIDQPQDYVRREIRLALSLRKRMHTVMVGSAQAPEKKQFPKDIAGLADQSPYHRFTSEKDINKFCNDVMKSGTQTMGLNRLIQGANLPPTDPDRPDFGARALVARIFVLSLPGDADGWRERIETDLRSRDLLASNLFEATAMLFIIGQHFHVNPLSPSRSGNDATHKMIHQALGTNKIIMPILVDGARMPESWALPQDIQQLSYRQPLIVKTESELPRALARAIWATRAEDVKRGIEKVASQRPKKSIFISYRRDDTGIWARSLARSLALKLSPETIFFDEGSEQPGLDFRAQFEDFLYQSTDMVVVIGSGFLEVDTSGRRRIDQPEDYVRREIRTALSLKKRIHVVLVGQVQMPTPEQLPKDIAELSEQRAIHRLTEKTDLDGIRDGILKSGISPIGLSPWNQGTKAWPISSVKPDYRTRASVTMKELFKYGWQIAGTSESSQDETVLVNDQFPNYRMVLGVNQAELALEEREKGVLILGSGRWARRAIFPISVYTLDDLDALRLPDRLLEAALDPRLYLDRTERIDLKRGKQPPMGTDELFKTIQDMVEPNPKAIERYQRLQRRLTSQGKPAPLTHEADIKFPSGAKPRTIAISSNGEVVVVGADHGLFRLSGQDWRMTIMKERGSYQSVDISPAGHIAACTNDNNISLWHADGAVIENSVSPYSWWRKVSDNPWIKFLSWSPEGNLLACCDKESIWTYAVAKNEFIHWKYPVEQEHNNEYGLKFAPNGREIAVFAYADHLWILDASTGAIHRSTTLQSRPFNFSWQSSEPRKQHEGLAFYDFQDIDLSPRGDILACAGSDGQIVLYDYGSLEPREIIAGHEPIHSGFWTRIANIVFSHDGQRLASLGSDNHLVIWETANWKPIGEGTVSWPPRLSGRRVIAWYPDGKRIIGCAEDTLEVWHV